MIVISSFVYSHGSSSQDTMISSSMIAVEFSTRQRCLEAVKFTKQQPKIYNAFCVQK
jgi:hypothetical protein